MVKSKRCIGCLQVLPLSEFYKCDHMNDGVVGRCKACTCIKVRENYEKSHAARCEYERRRYKDPERRKYVIEQTRKWRKRNPDKHRAHRMVSDAIRRGKIVRQGCEVCGAKAQAHHEDYSKPLDVRWFCFKHHREIGHGQRVNE